ncbi:hypothetical protein SDC9_187776 [bioreactor metagenome]|uniref:Uncharacterized protein n=1 Tax=bioreactor metagenome TaxID=1076179 RepID=A0A645HN35_9ZZZZ
MNQVRGGPVDVREAVDALPTVGIDCCHQLLILWKLSKVIGHADGIQGGAQNGVVHRAVHLLAKHVNLHVDLPDALYVLFARHQCHNSSSFQTLCPEGAKCTGQPAGILMMLNARTMPTGLAASEPTAPQPF